MFLRLSPKFGLVFLIFCNVSFAATDEREQISGDGESEEEKEFNKLLSEKPSIAGEIFTNEPSSKQVDISDYSGGTDKPARNYFDQDPLHVVKFYLYRNPRNPAASMEIPFGNLNRMRENSLPRETVLKILIHGFDASVKSSFPQDIKNAYLRNTIHPVICVDWGRMSGGDTRTNTHLYWNISSINLPKVSAHLGRFLIDLRKSNMISSLQQVHIVGHSLGAHMAGQASHIVKQEWQGEKIGRITGLDPAGINFEGRGTDSSLDATDADFVDIVHTSRFVGIKDAVGHVDFFPNSEQGSQPGCTGLTIVRERCNHNRAMVYYEKSITNPKMVGCNVGPKRRYNHLRKCSGICDNRVIFGEHISNRVRGEYCLSIQATTGSIFFPA